MRNLCCILEDGCSGVFAKQFSENYGYAKSTMLFDAFSSFMPYHIYNAWINDECECFALFPNRDALKINVDDTILTLLGLCNDDETTNVVVRIQYRF